jgi:hypothetical protein
VLHRTASKQDIILKRKGYPVILLLIRMHTVLSSSVNGPDLESEEKEGGGGRAKRKGGREGRERMFRG